VTGAGVDPGTGLNWRNLLEDGGNADAAHQAPAAISFSSSRPAESLFPLDEFRATCDEVIRSADAPSILQLGSPGGYTPLRHRLLEDARGQGVARATDDILITSGCQQALDLLDRVLIRGRHPVAIEDPVYPGIRNLFQASGARVSGLAVGPEGVAPESLAQLLTRERPRMVVLTPSFQNPTGATIPAAARRTILRMLRSAGAVLVENDIYGALRYEGADQPAFKYIDDSGDTVLLRSFSKISFPGLRVGWIIGPQPLIARLAEAKQLSDLHTDQLSQAILLRFLESGRLSSHLERTLAAGKERLRAALEACARHLPEGCTFTRPQGGMSLWVELPEALDSSELLESAQRRGVSYLPGRYFAVSRPRSNALRLSFAGLAPDRIEEGLAILGEVFRNHWRTRFERGLDPVPAIV
jgi:DNA-binding transcriptional MocR family regulator